MYSYKSGIRKTAVVWLATLMLLVTTAGAAFADTSSPYSGAVDKALTWMKTQQQPDGSFAGFGAGSTVDAVLAIVAAGEDPASFAQGNNTPVTFLQSNAATVAKTAGGAGKLLVGAHALGLDGKSFGGIDLVGAIQATYGISATGQYGPDVIDHAFALLGLEVSGAQPASDAVATLAGSQASDGGWAFAGVGKSDTNTTAVAIQALLAGGVKADSAPMQKALAYLLSQRNSDGGYPYQQGGDFGSDSDANSTAYVVQALLALGASKDTSAGQQYLSTLQNPSGAFIYQKAQPDDNAGATYQVVPALLGATLIDTKPPAPQVLPPAPGMPTTGSATDLPLAAFGFLLALASIGLGTAARRRETVSTRQ